MVLIGIWGLEALLSAFLEHQLLSHWEQSRTNVAIPSEYRATFQQSNFGSEGKMYS